MPNQTDALGFQIVSGQPATRDPLGFPAATQSQPSAPASPTQDALGFPIVASSTESGGQGISTPPSSGGGVGVSQEPDEDGNLPNEGFGAKIWNAVNTPLTESLGHSLLPSVFSAHAGSDPNTPGWLRGLEKVGAGLTSPLSLVLTAATLPFGGEGGFLESAGGSVLRKSLTDAGLDAAAATQKIQEFSTAAKAAEQAMRVTGQPVSQAVAKAGMDYGEFQALSKTLYDSGLKTEDLVGGNTIERALSKTFRAVSDNPVGAQQVAKYTETALQAGFAGQQLVQAFHTIPAFLDDVKDGNWDDASENLVEGVVSGGLGALALPGALRKVGGLIPAMNETTAFRPSDEAQAVLALAGERQGAIKAALSHAEALKSELNDMFGKNTYSGNLASVAFNSLKDAFEPKSEQESRAFEKAKAFYAGDSPNDTEYFRQMHNALGDVLGDDPSTKIQYDPEVAQRPNPYNIPRVNPKMAEGATASLQPEAGGAFVPPASGADNLEFAPGLHPRMPQDLAEILANPPKYPDAKPKSEAMLDKTPVSKEELQYAKKVYGALATGNGPDPAVMERIRDVDDNDIWVPAYKAGVLTEYTDDHVHRRFGPNYEQAAGPTVNDIRTGRFDLDVPSARRRVYTSIGEGLLRGHRLLVDDPVQSLADDYVASQRAIANRKFEMGILAKGLRASDFLPVGTILGSGDQLSERNGGPPSLIVNPDDIVDLTASQNDLARLQAHGMLQKVLDNGSLRDVTPHIRPGEEDRAIASRQMAVAANEARNPNYLNQTQARAFRDQALESVTTHANAVAEAVQDAIDNGKPIPEGLNVPQWVEQAARKDTRTTREQSELDAYVQKYRNFAQGQSRTGDGGLRMGDISGLLRQAAYRKPLTNPVNAELYTSNNHADLSLEEALKGTDDPAMQDYIKSLVQESKKRGYVLDHKTGTGFWSGKGGGQDGEPSVISRGTMDLADARALAAVYGKAGDQNSTLIWHPDETGPHYKYTIHLDGVDAAKAAGLVQKAGIGGATVESVDGGSILHIVDDDPTSKASKLKAEKINEYFGQDGLRRDRGTGEFLYKEPQVPGQASYDSAIREAAERTRGGSLRAGKGINDSVEGSQETLVSPELRDYLSKQAYQDKTGKWVLGSDKFTSKHVAQIFEVADDANHQQLKNEIQTLNGVKNGVLPKTALDEINAAQPKKYMWHPQGYVPSPRQLSKTKFLVKQDDGTNVFVNGEIRWHPEFANYIINSLGLDDNYLRNNKGIGAITSKLLTGGSELKSILLTGSPFHMMQLALRGIQTGVNPLMVHPVDEFSPETFDRFNAEKATVTDKLKTAPNDQKLLAQLKGVNDQLARADILRKGASHGLMLTTDRKSAYEHAEGLASHSKILAKIPILGKSFDWYHDLLFNRYMPSLKADAMVKMYGEYKAAHPEWTDGAVAKAAAEHVTNAFGGQDWRAMGRAAVTQDWFNLFALAPDWLESEMRFAASTTRGGMNGRNFTREQTLKMAAGLWGVARVLNLLYSGKPHLEAPFGLATKDQNGRDIIYSMRTLPTDILHMAQDPMGFLKGRMSPVARTAAEVLTGRDQFGRQLGQGDLWVDMARNMAPIPIQQIGATINGATPQTSNFGQAVKAFGGTATIYRTEAEKLAGDLAGQRNENGPLDDTSRNRLQAVSRFEDDLRSGRMTWGQLDNLKDFSHLPHDEIKKIKDNVKLTAGLDPQTARMVSSVSRMAMPDALQVWNLATPKERVALAKTFAAKKTRYMADSYKKMTPEERLHDPTFLAVRQIHPEPGE